VWHVKICELLVIGLFIDHCYKLSHCILPVCAMCAFTLMHCLPVHYYVNVFYLLYFYFLVTWLYLDCLSLTSILEAFMPFAVYFIKQDESLAGIWIPYRQYHHRQVGPSILSDCCRKWHSTVPWSAKLVLQVVAGCFHRGSFRRTLDYRLVQSHTLSAAYCHHPWSPASYLK